MTENQACKQETQDILFPEKLGHDYRFVACYDLSLLQTKFSQHRRLRVFSTYGVHCAQAGCDKKGVYLIKARNNAGGFHIDLYTKDFELMTIDHILPRSLGGDSSIQNLQPMCNSCNARKGNKI
ncbi:MAG: HNH endonuclease [Chitinophagaceae bacterium]|nr:HNH endonuclease [Chitinophagaceae bacterium]